MSLARARAIRESLALGDPPEGWPVVVAVGYNGRPAPKCSLIECPEPGVIHIKFIALDIEAQSSSVYSCRGHLDHFAAAGAEWVR